MGQGYNLNYNLLATVAVSPVKVFHLPLDDAKIASGAGKDGEIATEIASKPVFSLALAALCGTFFQVKSKK